MNPNSIPSVESPAHVTQGQVKRTLRGMDGRIRHVEALLAQARDGRMKRLDAAEAVTKAVVYGMANLRAEVANLEAGLAIVRAQVEEIAKVAAPSATVDNVAPSLAESEPAS